MTSQLTSACVAVVIVATRKPNRLRIYEAIIEYGPGLRQCEIMRLLGISKQLVRYHLMHLPVFDDPEGEIGPKHGWWPCG